jgi:4-amino-4-deoxy-L-arabinose transferase-like glycosyltransferase
MSVPTPAGPQGVPDVIRTNSLLFVCVLCALWILPGLIGHDPWKPDEAYSFGLVYHILQGGNWIVPTLVQEPFLEKPPVYYLTAALLAKTLGGLLPLHDAARLVSGLYMALTFLLVGLTSRELHGSGKGWLAVLALLGSFGLLLPAHYLLADVAELTGFSLALYGMALCTRRPALGGVALGCGIGLAFLSKGMLALGSMSLAAAALPLLSSQWRTRDFLLTAMIALAAALPWMVIWPWLLYRHSPALFQEWFKLDSFGSLFGANKLGPTVQPGYYVYQLLWFGFPLLPLAAWAIWQGRRSLRTEAGLLLPLTVFLATLVLLSFSRISREIYAMPLLVPLAALAVPGVLTLRRGAANAFWSFALLFTGFMVLLGWFYWMGVDLGFPPRLHRHLMRMQPGYAPHFNLFKFTFALALTLFWIWVLTRLRRSPERPLIAHATGITLIWGLGLSLFMSYADTGKSYRPMVVSMAHALPSEYRCISARNLGDPQRAMLEYFAGIVTYRDEIPGRQRQCDLLLVQGSRTSIHQPGPSWTKIWEGSRLGDDKELFQLYRRG